MLLKLGDSVTTDHISPAGAIKEESPAGRYLKEHGVERKDFNSYGSRRGNHEVMIRGTFANIRLRNELRRRRRQGAAPGRVDRRTSPTAASRPRCTTRRRTTPRRAPRWWCWRARSTAPGSSRDWAAKGTTLLGVRAVIAESYERIHRSNLVGMGVLPLQYPDGQDADSLGLTGTETFSISGVTGAQRRRRAGHGARDGRSRSRATRSSSTRGCASTPPARRSTTCNGGILPYVLRKMLG